MPEGIGSYGPCEICGTSNTSRVNCVNALIAHDDEHLHLLCGPCDDQLLVGDVVFPPCPDEMTEADRVLQALRRVDPLTPPRIFCEGLACKEIPDGSGRFCPSHGPGETVLT